MNAFATHFSFEFRTGLRDRSLLLLYYLFPLGFYLLVGVLMTQINPMFRETLIPAMVTFAVLSGMLLGLPNPLVAAREAGIFRSYRINGVPALSIIGIPAITTSLHLILVAGIITATAPLILDVPLPASWPGFVLIFLALLLACAGLGVLIGVVSANTRATVLWSQLFYLPSMLIGGLMVPASMLPVHLQRVGKLLPPAHAMDAYVSLRDGGLGAAGFWTALAVLAAGGLFAFGLAIYLFRWDNDNPSRRAHPALALAALLPYAVAALAL